MRKLTRLAVIFLIVGLIFLIVIGVTSLLLSAVGYGDDPVHDLPAPEPAPEEPEEPLHFRTEDSGWLTADRGDLTILRGADISDHQSDPDWHAMREAGADFVMLRAGYRGYTDGGLFEDSSFRDYAEGALDAGLQVGVYFFSQAVTVEEAEEEAKFVIDLLKDLDITWPVAFDWEDVAAVSRTDSLSGRDMTACALAFCSRIRRAGYIPAIYANQHQVQLYYGYAEEELQDVVLWLADYTDTPSCEQEFQIWQYTDSGSLPGISASVDLNLSFTDYRKR